VKMLKTIRLASGEQAISGAWYRRNVDGTDPSGGLGGELIAVYRVMHRLRHHQRLRLVISDLIFYGTEPHVVLRVGRSFRYDFPSGVSKA
jgi:hypothetical protein